MNEIFLSLPDANSFDVVPTKFERLALKRWYLWVPLPFVILFVTSILAGLAANRQISLSPELSPTDLKEVPSLAEKLRVPTNAISSYLSRRLSEATRTYLSNSKNLFADTEILEPALREHLNNVIKGDSIYRPVRFQGIKFRRSTQRFLWMRLHYCPGISN